MPPPPPPSYDHKSLLAFLGFGDTVRLRGYVAGTVGSLVMASLYVLVGLVENDTDEMVWFCLALWAAISVVWLVDRKRISWKQSRQPWSAEGRAIMDKLRQINDQGALEERLGLEVMNGLDRCIGLHLQVSARLDEPGTIWKTQPESIERMKKILLDLTEEGLRIANARLRMNEDEAENATPALLSSLSRLEGRLLDLNRLQSDPYSVADQNLHQRLEAISQPKPIEADAKRVAL